MKLKIEKMKYQQLKKMVSAVDELVKVKSHYKLDMSIPKEMRINLFEDAQGFIAALHTYHTLSELEEEV